MAKSPPIRRGAVAVLDALGFKGIWHDRNPREIIDALKSAETVAKGQERSELGSSGNRARLQTHARAFSDTLILACTYSEGSHIADDMDSWAVCALCYMTSSFIGQVIGRKLPLVYRGSIAVGRVEVDGQFLVGQAIDDAATEEKRAEGAFVWLTPAATSAYEKLLFGNDSVVVRYPVPMKGGFSFSTWVVNPLWFLPEDVTAERILQSFDRTPTVEVGIKRQHTAAFLVRAPRRPPKPKGFQLAKRPTGRG